jgi:hypothetical protein
MLLREPELNGIEEQISLNILYRQSLAPRGAWLRQKSCQEISCSRSGGIKEVSFV